MKNLQDIKKKFNLQFTAGRNKRIVAGVIFLSIAGFFLFFRAGAVGKIDTNRLFDPCGFKLEHGLPCPTCGMTASIKAFCTGKLLKSIYLQPAAAVLCGFLAIIAVLALLTAVFGLNFGFANRRITRVSIGYTLLIIIVILAAGWAVTLARAIAEKNL